MIWLTAASWASTASFAELLRLESVSPERASMQAKFSAKLKANEFV